MLDKIFGNHLTDLSSALSRTTQRQSLLTTNLANVNVPGYKRKDIDFHSALVDEMGGPTQALLDQKDAQAQAQSDSVSLRADGNNVDIEREMTGIAETDLRYQTLTEMTTQYFSQLKNVIREGK